jgi:alpha-galactosidase
MGWSSWNAYAATDALNETTILKVMDALVARPAGGESLLDRGYRYVNLDDGIVLKTRDSRGALVVDSQRFPRGLAFLSREAHTRGLLFGVYTARGPRTCCGKAGSFGHEHIDAQTYSNDWQVDYLKNDGCTGGKQLPGPENASAVLYARMRDAVAATGRKIFLNIKQDIVPGGFGAGCDLANSFRIADDIKPCMGESGLITDIAATALRFAGPGCFLDRENQQQQQQQQQQQRTVLSRTL